MSLDFTRASGYCVFINYAISLKQMTQLKLLLVIYYFENAGWRFIYSVFFSLLYSKAMPKSTSLPSNWLNYFSHHHVLPIWKNVGIVPQLFRLQWNAQVTSFYALYSKSNVSFPLREDLKCIHYFSFSFSYHPVCQGPLCFLYSMQCGIYPKDLLQKSA